MAHELFSKLHRWLPRHEISKAVDYYTTYDSIAYAAQHILSTASNYHLAGHLSKDEYENILQLLRVYEPDIDKMLY